MADSFEEEMMFIFEEEHEQFDNNIATSEEVNEYLYCGNTKYCVC